MISTKNKTVVFVTDRFEIGGVSSFIDAYTSYLHVKKYKTVILAEDGITAHDDDYFNTSELVILPLGFGAEQTSPSLNRIVYRINFIKKFLTAFKILVKKYQISVVHFNLTWSALSLLIFYPGIRKHSLVLTFYGDTALELRNQNEKLYASSRFVRFKLRLLKELQKVTLHLVNKIISPSKYLKSYLIKKFQVPENKITVIYGGLEPQYKKFAHTQKTGGLYNRQVINLLHISRFEHRKGQDILLRALRIVLDREFHNVRLTISGPFEGDIYPLLMLYEKLSSAQN